MLKATLIKSLLSVSILAGLCTAEVAFAANPAASHQKHTVVSRHVDKQKTDTGVSRHITKTDDKGAVATRDVEVTRDKVAGTHQATVSGTTFDGKTYTGESSDHRTDTGYVSQGQIRTSDGKVVDRSVVATVDKSAGTVTKNISVTPEGGETKTRTVVHPLKKAN